jgi:hypothetical protein
MDGVNMKDLKMIHIDCQCGSPECAMRLMASHDEDMVYIDLQSYRWESFFKRLVTACKYVFGNGNVTWVSIIPSNEDIPKLIRFLKKARKHAKHKRASMCNWDTTGCGEGAVYEAEMGIS